MNYIQIILLAAKKAQISGTILLAICMQESNLRNVAVMQDGISPTFGICQIKYDTAKMLGYKGEPEGLMDPSVNSKYAAKYLKHQYDRYGGDWCKSIASFNAGSYIESKKKPGYPKNLRYVNGVKKKLAKPFDEIVSCDKIYNNEEMEYIVSENNGSRR